MQNTKNFFLLFQNCASAVRHQPGVSVRPRIRETLVSVATRPLSVAFFVRMAGGDELRDVDCVGRHFSQFYRETGFKALDANFR